MISIKKFADFINEKQIKPADDGYQDNFDKDLESKVQDYIEKNSDNCPRCGEHMDDCQCDINDYWSTQNYHRVSKGITKKLKPKQKFKK
jgi:hypothetical protein